MKFKILLAQDGDVIDTFEVSVSHDKTTEGSSEALLQKANGKAFTALKSRSVAQQSRVASYISKAEKAVQLATDMQKKIQENGEDAITSEEEQEGERVFGEMYATEISMDVYLA